VYFNGIKIGYFYSQDYKSNDTTYVACGRLETEEKLILCFGILKPDNG